MCRIAGIISASLTTDEISNKINLMCNALKHGGPDDMGTFLEKDFNLAFGHRRLSIIDLSSNGHQPMADIDKKAWITFNGEIYNYPELKDELIKAGAAFYSNTDTEVILQAYLHWGITAFNKLRGMFAFALFDSVAGFTYLVRDTLGIKPLYYNITSSGISFASEVRAFKAAGLACTDDENWPIRFLAFGHIPEPYTTLKNVYNLPKGHFLRWAHHSNKHEILPYFDPVKSIELIADINEAKKSISTALNKAIERQLLADAPLGVFLSGGVDSSLLTLLADRYKKTKLKTISIFFDEDEFNERKYQNIITEKTGTQNDAHLVSRDDFDQALPNIIHDMDMPTTDGVNSWFISKYAQQSNLKAVLSGLGADELFGGYPSFNRIKYLKYLKLIPSSLLNTMSRLSVGPIKRLSLLTYKHPLADYLFLRGLFTPNDIAGILNVKKERVLEVLFAQPLDLSNLNDQEKAGWFETNLYMQNQLLRDTDVMSMAHGLEVRVPFLDEDFVQTVKSIEPSIRFNNTKPKQLLIDSNGGVLPEEVWNRPKMGFSFPLQQWMLTNNQISTVSLYNNRAAKKIISRFKNNGGVHWSKAFALYQLQKLGKIEECGKPTNVMLLTLETFSATGGIQKMTRTLAHVLEQIAHKKNWRFDCWSGYDKDCHLDLNYVSKSNFKAFNKHRRLFAAKAIKTGLHADVVVLSHINLALIGWLIKRIRPKTKVLLIAHGIEVWRPLSYVKKALLANCDKIICVSNFTKQKIIDLHQAPADKCIVLNNALDPLVSLPADLNKPEYLLKRYNFTAKNQVIFTLTRLASSEQYKGYEKVIKAISKLKNTFPDIRYILSGKYDKKEEVRIHQLINQYGVAEQTIVTGYVNENELQDHFLLTDVFVLPSKKEGFGIVFIEALSCGLPVICGNEDGSRDAIRDGELGKAIETDNVPKLTEAIKEYLVNPLKLADRKQLQKKCLQYFNADLYEDNLEKILTK